MDWKLRFWTKTRLRAEPSFNREGLPLGRPCRIWMGAKDQKGYGLFRVPEGVKGLTPGPHRSHRIAFFIAKGPFPKKLQIDHECRNRACVEATHFILTGPSEHARVSNKDKYQ